MGGKVKLDDEGKVISAELEVNYDRYLKAMQKDADNWVKRDQLVTKNLKTHDVTRPLKEKDYATLAKVTNAVDLVKSLRDEGAAIYAAYYTADNLASDVRKHEEKGIEELFSVADKQSAELLAEIDKQIEHLELVQKEMLEEKAKLKDEIRALIRKESADFFKELATIRDDLKELGTAYDRKQWDFSDTHMKKYLKK